ncbi:MAG: sulfatase family protein [Planctomycetota bacterium]|jgi:arylsulfatase A-like enzyme
MDSSSPTPAAESAPFRPGAGRVLRAALNAGALAGLWVGLADGLRVAQALHRLPEQAILPATPLGLFELLPNFAGAVLLYGALGIPLALIAAVALGKFAPGPGPVTFEKRVFTCVAGGLLALLAIWWQREVQASGLPVTDVRRLLPMLGLAFGSLVFSWLLGHLLYRRYRKLHAASSIAVLLAWLVGFGTLVQAGRARDAEGALNDRNRDLPNVVFVIVDALRADMLEPYGNATVQTPHLNELAESGVVFEDAWVQAPFTGASFGSFFTGKYPRRHGLLTMEPGMRVAPGKTFIHLLEEGTRPDGTTMEDADYSTASFMTGAMSHGSGLMEGFDAYQEIMLGRDLTQVKSGWSIFKGYLAPVAVAFKLRIKADRAALVRAAPEWIRQHEDRRFAMFVHLYSTHTPYDPAPEFRAPYVDPTYDGPIQRFSADNRVTIEKGEYALTPEDVQQIGNLYMGGVTEADHHIGVLIEALVEIDALNDTVFVVTSDHGEDLGRGSGLQVESNTVTSIGRWEHNHMYKSNLWVPLIIRAAGRLPYGVRVQAAVEGVDWLPTLAELCDLQLPGLQGADVHSEEYVDGVSLVDAANAASIAGEVGEPGPVKAFRIAEDATYVSITDGRYMLTVERWGVLEEGWQIVLEGLPGGSREPIGSVRFHDLETHTSGEVDLFKDIVRNGDATPELRAQVLGEVERLRGLLVEWNRSQPRAVESIERSERDRETDENEAKRLEALGYGEDFNVYQGELREAVLERRGE